LTPIVRQDGAPQDADDASNPELCTCRPANRRQREGGASMTAKQRVVLGALRDVQHEHDGEGVSADQVAAACPPPWKGRADLVSDSLWLLHAHGFVVGAARSANAWEITTAGRLMLEPRHGPVRRRHVTGGGHHHS
jgi:hypothetical protein